VNETIRLGTSYTAISNAVPSTVDLLTAQTHKPQTTQTHVYIFDYNLCWQDENSNSNNNNNNVEKNERAGRTAAVVRDRKGVGNNKKKKTKQIKKYTDKRVSER